MKAGKAKENKTLFITFAQGVLNANLKGTGRRGKVRKWVICIIVVLWMKTPIPPDLIIPFILPYFTLEDQYTCFLLKQQ